MPKIWLNSYFQSLLSFGWNRTWTFIIGTGFRKNNFGSLPIFINDNRSHCHQLKYLQLIFFSNFLQVIIIYARRDHRNQYRVPAYVHALNFQRWGNIPASVNTSSEWDIPNAIRKTDPIRIIIFTWATYNKRKKCNVKFRDEI